MHMHMQDASRTLTSTCTQDASSWTSMRTFEGLTHVRVRGFNAHAPIRRFNAHTRSRVQRSTFNTCMFAGSTFNTRAFEGSTCRIFSCSANHIMFLSPRELVYCYFSCTFKDIRVYSKIYGSVHGSELSEPGPWHHYSESVASRENCSQ